MRLIRLIKIGEQLNDIFELDKDFLRLNLRKNASVLPT